jgi:hypothetical protein
LPSRPPAFGAKANRNKPSKASEETTRGAILIWRIKYGFLFGMMLRIAESDVPAKIQPNGTYFISPPEGSMKRRMT